MNNMIWRPIDEFDGLYEVSDLGLVRSTKRDLNMGMTLSKEGLIKPKLDKDCYLSVTLCNHGIEKTRHIQRLVAKAFIPNPENKPIVDHINGIRWDNRVQNLQWATPSENTQAAFDRGFKKVAGRAIIQFTLDGLLIRRYEKIVDVEKHGYKSKSVNNAVKGASNYKLYGFIWRYAE